MDGKGIEGIAELKDFGRGKRLGKGDGGMKVRRVFTNYDRADYLDCQYLSEVLVF